MQEVTEPRGPTEDMMKTIWRNCNSQTGFSWERLNKAMAAGLRLAIGSGFQLHASDLEAILGKYRGGRWLGEKVFEPSYALAVAVGNAGACKTIEEYYGRAAFIVDDVDGLSRSEFLHMSGTRKRGRVAIGSRFPWDGSRVTVTSFSVEYFIAVARPDDNDGEKSRQFKITRADIKAERKARKEAKESQGGK